MDLTGPDYRESNRSYLYEKNHKVSGRRENQENIRYRFTSPPSGKPKRSVKDSISAAEQHMELKTTVKQQ
ncbi:unnamed protein product [Schistosoma margrebowiei]|uniref:Uncharacterized protein n=1 Tax=Schistosoma margrebowiei TaxID=48269 RepID=A0A183LT32_9TREM|nr:unnamed protein product [Schistosoma margrebowiei]